MIEVKDLWKSFGSKEVLRGLNLEVDEGITLVILGRSGVGKSVLLRLMLGMDKADRGNITIGGAPISTLSGRHLYEAIRSMGMLFQGSALFDSLSVGENTAFYLRQHGDPHTKRRVPEAEVQARVSEALSMVDLEGIEHIMPSELSGGMKKRAALARLIVYRPRILLYDEPTTGLDPVTAQQINQLILRTQQELRATSIVVTHDLHSAIEVGDLLALHHEGKIAVLAEPKAFLQDPHPMIQDFVRNSVLHQGAS